MAAEQRVSKALSARAHVGREATDYARAAAVELLTLLDEHGLVMTEFVCSPWGPFYGTMQNGRQVTQWTEEEPTGPTVYGRCWQVWPVSGSDKSTFHRLPGEAAALVAELRIPQER